MSKVAKIAATVIAVAAAIPSGGTSLLAVGLGSIGAGAALAGVGITLSTGAAILGIAAFGVNLALSAGGAVGTGSGTQTDWSADPRAPVPIRFGRTGGSGQIVYRKGSGPSDDNRDQTLVTVLSGAGPIDAIESSYADKKLLAFNGTAATAPFAGWLWEARQLGACPEPAALNTNVGNKPGWTAAHKLSGLAAVMTTLRYDSKGKGTFMTEPNMLWVSRNVLCYDPRKDSTYPGGSGPQRWFDQETWAFSKNPYVVGLTWAIGWKENGVRVAGVGIPVHSIDVARYVEGANIADFNGWTCGGEVTTADDKWLVLKSILQAGGGEPIKDGAMLSCMVNAPRVPIATIMANDIVGEINAPRTQRRVARVNGIIPTYRSEAHFWEVVPGDVVRDAAMLAKDGGERTKEIAYGLVQVEGDSDVSQAVELAGYDLENAREAGPITMPLKTRWIGFKAGDCVICDADGSGLVGKQLILLKRSLDPATGMVPMTMRTEDPAKHARVFARTGTLPPAPAPYRPAIPGDFALPEISDRILSAPEKRDTIIRYNQMIGDLAALNDRYAALGEPDDLNGARDAATIAVGDLNDYLATLDPAWDDATQDTVVVPGDYRLRWSAALIAVAEYAAAITGRPGEPGENGVSPYVLSVDTSALIVNATYLGETKGGQLPRRALVSVRQGATDVIADTDIVVTTSGAAIVATYAAGEVSIAQVDADGWVQVAASRGGEPIDSVRIAVSRKLDAPPPATPTLVSTAAYTGDPQSTSYSAVPDAGIITVQADAAGSVGIEVYVEYLVAQLGTTIRHYTMAGKVMYRPAGSGGTWSDLIGNTSGSPSSYAPATDEHEPGALSISQSAALSPNASYEFALLLRKSLGNGQAGYVTSFLSVGKS